MCLRIQSRAATSAPRIQRWTNGRRAAPSRAGSKRRTNAAGRGPSTPSTDSMESSTAATRPNASPAAQNPTTSRSSDAGYRRTRWTGSTADSAWSKVRYS